MAYDVISVTWVEDPTCYESYWQTRTVEATNVDKEYAEVLAEMLVDMWTSVEEVPVERFVNGVDRSAYVEDWSIGKARGIRVTVLPHK